MNEGPALLAQVGDQYRPKGLCRACVDSIIRISIRAVVILSLKAQLGKPALFYFKLY